MGEAEFAALGQRIGRLKTAIALGQPDRVPVAPFFDGVAGQLRAPEQMLWTRRVNSPPPFSVCSNVTNS